MSYNLSHSFVVPNSMIDVASVFNCSSRTISKYTKRNKVSSYKSATSYYKITNISSLRYRNRGRWHKTSMYQFAANRDYNKNRTSYPLTMYYHGKYGFSQMIDDMLSGYYEPRDEYVDIREGRI